MIKTEEGGLQFSDLRMANIARLPQFKNKWGIRAHPRADGSDWTPAQWLGAVLGELGEYANKRKKFERGDITLEQFKVEAQKELADVIIYLDILALRCLDDVMHDQNLDMWAHIPHPTGVNLADAVTLKFNEVSVRVNSSVRLGNDGMYLLNDEAATFPNRKVLPQYPFDMMCGGCGLTFGRHYGLSCTMGERAGEFIPTGVGVGGGPGGIGTGDENPHGGPGGTGVVSHGVSVGGGAEKLKLTGNFHHPDSEGGEA